MLFDSVFDGLVIIEDECVVQANQGMGKMFGYRRDELDELVGKPVNDLFPLELIPGDPSPIHTPGNSSG